MFFQLFTYDFGIWGGTFLGRLFEELKKYRKLVQGNVNAAFKMVSWNSVMANAVLVCFTSVDPSCVSL